MTQLTEHFTLEEMVTSGTADACGIDNTPPQEVIGELTKTAELLEIVRAIIEQPIFVTSGYRCDSLNYEVGGVPDSQHCTGQAVDFIAPDYGSADRVFEAIRDAQPPVPFDQLISEYGEWVHISQSGTPRHEVLVY